MVEKGGSLIIDGQVTLFGRYNTGSVVLNYGTLELTGDAIVTGSKITNDLANGTAPVVWASSTAGARGRYSPCPAARLQTMNSTAVQCLTAASSGPVREPA